MPGGREGDSLRPMARAETLTDAEAQHLARIRDDCADCLGPGAQLLDVRREPAQDGVSIVARYRLGQSEHESAGSGETMVVAHSVLRARLLFDRIRFGFSDFVEHS